MKSRDTSGKNEDMIKSYEIKLVMDTFSQNWGANGPAQSISVSSLESMLVLYFWHMPRQTTGTKTWGIDGN